MRVSLLIAILILISCNRDQPKNLPDLEKQILTRPLVGAVDFYQENDSTLKGFEHHLGSYKYFLKKEFNDSFSNGFFGPVTNAYVFDQLISFDIESEGKWEILNQTAFPGRLVQNSRKGPFSISQTLFFADSLISVSVYSIQNKDTAVQELNSKWTYFLNQDLKLENRIGFQGLRFLTPSGEYWPHCSGRDDYRFNSDSTRVTKNTKAVHLFPDEKIELYSVLYIGENLDTILRSNRPKPWLYFPEEQLDKNIMEWSKKMD